VPEICTGASDIKLLTRCQLHVIMAKRANPRASKLFDNSKTAIALRDPNRGI
jgi:hypothetical protein